MCLCIVVVVGILMKQFVVDFGKERGLGVCCVQKKIIKFSEISSFGFKNKNGVSNNSLV